MLLAGLYESIEVAFFKKAENASMLNDSFTEDAH